MTETMLAAVVCPMHGTYKEGSVGLPLPDVDVRIVDVDTGEQTLPPGELGEMHHQRAPDHGGLLAAPGRDSRHDP